MDPLINLVYSIGILMTGDEAKMNKARSVVNSCKSPTLQCADVVAETNFQGIKGSVESGVYQFKRAQEAMKKTTLSK